MALPFIRLLQDRQQEIVILTPQMYADCFRTLPNVEVHEFANELRHGLSGTFTLAREIRDLRLSHGYILSTSFSSALSFWLAKVPNRIGISSDSRGVLLTQRHSSSSRQPKMHRSETYCKLLGEVNHQASLLELSRLQVDPDAQRSIRARLARDGMAVNEPYAVFPFRAVAASRRWGRENYSALGKALVREHKIRIILTGTTADISEGEWIRSEIGDGTLSFAGQTSLAELAALMADSRVVIGNDSGPCHLAAAVGAPLVVLSGADDPQETSPLSEKKVVLQVEQLDCLGCVKNDCPLAGDRHMKCMRGLGVSRVLDAANRMLFDR